MKITSQSSASRAKHLRDFDSLARMLGPNDRATADLRMGERRLLGGLSESAQISDLGGTALQLLLGPSAP